MNTLWFEPMCRTSCVGSMKSPSHASWPGKQVGHRPVGYDTKRRAVMPRSNDTYHAVQVQIEGRSTHPARPQRTSASAGPRTIDLVAASPVRVAPCPQGAMQQDALEASPYQSRWQQPRSQRRLQLFNQLRLPPPLPWLASTTFPLNDNQEGSRNSGKARVIPNGHISEA